MSTDCQDLLLALLQRDPLARISFDDFFAHSFLDLEHVPSPVCLDKAVSEPIFVQKVIIIAHICINTPTTQVTSGNLSVLSGTNILYFIIFYSSFMRGKLQAKVSNYTCMYVWSVGTNSKSSLWLITTAADNPVSQSQQLLTIQ